MLKELSSLVTTGSSHIILDLAPATIEEADHLQQIWPVSAAFLFTDCEGIYNAEHHKNRNINISFL